MDDTPPEDLRLQREEVEAVLRIGLDDAGALRTVGSAPAREYRAGTAFDTRIGDADFVPHEDDYLRRISSVARQLLAGERPEKIF